MAYFTDRVLLRDDVDLFLRVFFKDDDLESEIELELEIDIELEADLVIDLDRVLDLEFVLLLDADLLEESAGALNLIVDTLRAFNKSAFNSSILINNLSISIGT